jgi:hypothetical protein
VSIFSSPSTPGGRSRDSREEVMGRPPEGTRVGQTRPGAVEKGDPESTSHSQGKRDGQSKVYQGEGEFK